MMHCQRETRPERPSAGPGEVAGVEALAQGLGPAGSGERRLHAMKNHLTVIDAGLALLERSIAPEQRERLLVMRRAADDLARLVANEIAPVARPAAREFVDLVALVREVGSALGLRASEGGVVLECEIEPCVVLGDRQTLAEALSNLVLNAIEATPPAGRVRVEVRPSTGGAEICVVDTGHGMGEETLARLGQRGFTTRRGGSGLGLSIARRGVEELGGTMRFESVSGVGTRVTVVLG